MARAISATRVTRRPAPARRAGATRTAWLLAAVALAVYAFSILWR